MNQSYRINFIVTKIQPKNLYPFLILLFPCENFDFFSLICTFQKSNSHKSIFLRYPLTYPKRDPNQKRPKMHEPTYQLLRFRTYAQRKSSKMFPTTTVILVRTYSEGGSTPVKRKSISTYIQALQRNKSPSQPYKHTDPQSVGREKENNSKKNDEE